MDSVQTHCDVFNYRGQRGVPNLDLSQVRGGEADVSDTNPGSSGNSITHVYQVGPHIFRWSATFNLKIVVAQPWAAAATSSFHPVLQMIGEYNAFSRVLLRNDI